MTILAYIGLYLLISVTGALFMGKFCAVGGATE